MLTNIPQFDGNITSSSSINTSISSKNTGFPIPVLITTRGFNTKYEQRVPVRKVIKRNPVIQQAQALPTIMNINPRSIYNKVNEFLTLVEQYQANLIFLSETWDRIEKPLDTIINIDEHRVYTSINPRNFKGGETSNHSG